MTVVNLCPQEVNQGVNYKPFEPIKIDNDKYSESFFVRELRKEVESGSQNQKRKNIKKLKKIYKGFGSILALSIITTPRIAFASPQTTEILGDGGGIEPAQIMQMGFTVALIMVSIGVAISGSLLAVAGVYRMFRKQKEAQDWTSDIIKGLVQVLVALPTVYALFYLAQLVFQNLPVLEGLL